MTEDEAEDLLAQVKAGRMLRVQYEGPDAHCSLTVRYEDGSGLIGSRSEIPFDVLSPWRDEVASAWSEDELVRFLTGLRGEVETG
ncbi:hypothetical protein [Longimicrobium sp.]|uniref:hypothetical protein n=1 Tax=Longimicrobium sp. TaxID=2029185 RepID=UPI002C3C879B|nr:hypothetical protein [Longimicrobium sp.]HSU12619.1 hypothetical protein [Longimicrobium sp.]